MDASLIPWLVFGYVLGSIPFGLVLTKLAGLGDIRKVGSGNIGATNVLRTGNKFIALLTVLLDGGKGAAALLITLQYAPDAAPYAGLSAFLGHLYLVWLKFKGGKGVATFLGLALATNLWLGLICCAAWLLTAVIFRYSSLAALVSVVVSPIYAFIMLSAPAGAIFVVISLLIFWSHRANIGRLLNREEPKIGQS